MPKIVYTQEYNRKDYSPAMPVLEIGVSRAGRNQPAITVEAMIDSGSDGTLIPLDYLERADAQYIIVHLSVGLQGIVNQPTSIWLQSTLAPIAFMLYAT